MNSLKIHARLEKIKNRKRATCPECKKRSLTGKWSATGPSPSIKIYVQKCPQCNLLVLEHKIIEQAIQEDSCIWKWMHSIYHTLDAIEILHNLTKADSEGIKAELCRRNIYW